MFESESEQGSNTTTIANRKFGHHKSKYYNYLKNKKTPFLKEDTKNAHK